VWSRQVREKLDEDLTPGIDVEASRRFDLTPRLAPSPGVTLSWGARRD
jgi:hypothetical protein